MSYYLPPPQPTDTTAILGLIFTFVFAPAGLVLSIIGLRRTNNTPDRTGYTMALIGTILSALATLALLGWVGSFIALVTRSPGF